MVIVLIVAINPGQKLAETRDTGRLSSVNQIGRALQAYATNKNGVFPVADATWMQTLVDTKEISSLVSNPTYTITTPCTITAKVNNYCYSANVGTTSVIVYAGLEADKYTKTLCLGASGDENAWAVWSSSLGRSGVVCSTTEPTYAVSSFSL